jgi:hypothetical protein
MPARVGRRRRSVLVRWVVPAGPGVIIVLEGASIDSIRERMDTLPFVIEGLMALEYDEIYEI